MLALLPVILWLSASHPVHARVDSIDFPSTVLTIPSNYEVGEEIIGDEVFRAKPENDEDVALMVAPSSDAIVIAPSIVQPGSIFQIFIKDLETIKEKTDYKLQALGLISGDLQEVPLVFQFAADEVVTPTSFRTLMFEKSNQDIQLKEDFQKEEIFTIKLTSGYENAYDIELLGDLSSHFSLKTENENIYISSIPCKECNLPDQFTLMLMASRIPGASANTIINFTNKKKKNFKFLQEMYQTEVEEEAPIFKKVVKLRTNGEDEVMYSLEDVSGLFSVHPTTGVLSIQHPEFLNSETVGNVVNLTAVAKSGDKKAIAMIEIRVVPKSEAQSFKFPEESYSFNVEAGERDVGSVKIPSAENIDYRISEGDGSIFTVFDGQIVFIGEFPKETKMFQLLILGQSTSSPFSVDVVPININIVGIGSNGVQFKGDTDRIVQLPAETVPETTILNLEVIDKDEDSTMEYSLDNFQSYNTNGQLIKSDFKPLIIHENGKSVALLLKNSIMNKDISRMHIEIIVNDVAHPQEPNAVAKVEILVVRSKMIMKEPVPLRILPVPSAIVLKPDTPIGSFVYQAYTTHPNSDVLFTLPKHPQEFEINTLTGVITTKSKLTPGSRILLNILAVEGSEKTEGLFVIEITSEMDTLFHFKQKLYEIEIPLSTVIESPVLTVNIDRNISDIEYNILGTTFFTINEKGNISTALPFSKDNLQHNFVVEARSPSGKTMTEVAVKIIPSEPLQLKFDKQLYTVDLMGDIPLNSFVTAIQASGSNGTIQYTIETGKSSEKLLDIDEEGRITIRNEIKDKSFEEPIRIRATDGINEAFTDLKLNATPAFSCVPEFEISSNDAFDINENSDVGSSIGQLKVEPINEKCNLTYHFWDETEKRLTQETDFAIINEKTGEIKSLRVFDFEKKRNYPLTFAIKAGGRMITKHASILNINDMDDHPLKFDFTSITVEVSEAAPVGTVVTTVTAMEPDASQEVYYRLKYDSEHFHIEPKTGIITLAKELDREDEDRFEIVVGASNSADSDPKLITEFCTVQVVVKDVNDNGPLFERGKYEMVLDKMELPGKDLLTVHAEDPDLSDETPNSVFYFAKETSFEYKGLKRSVDGIFHVNQQTGEIRLEETVNEFVGGVFHMVLEATDSLEPKNARKDTAVLRVYVHDQSDVVGSQIEKSPIVLKSADVQELIQTVANATSLKVLLKDIKYEHLEDNLIHDASDIQMIVVNKTSSEVIPAEKVLAIVSKLSETSNHTILPFRLRKSYQSDGTISHASTSPIIYFILIFLLLLSCMCAIFGLLLCHYRSGYRKERKLHEDSLVIASTLNRTKHRPFSLSPIETSQSTTTDRDDEYSVQERKLSVI